VNINFSLIRPSELRENDGERNYIDIALSYSWRLASLARELSKVWIAEFNLQKGDDHSVRNFN